MQGFRAKPLRSGSARTRALCILVADSPSISRRKKLRQRTRPDRFRSTSRERLLGVSTLGEDEQEEEASLLTSGQGTCLSKSVRTAGWNSNWYHLSKRNSKHLYQACLKGSRACDYSSTPNAERVMITSVCGSVGGPLLARQSPPGWPSPEHRAVGRRDAVACPALGTGRGSRTVTHAPTHPLQVVTTLLPVSVDRALTLAPKCIEQHGLFLCTLLKKIPEVAIH